MPTLPGATPSLSHSPTLTPLPGPGSVLDSQHLPPWSWRRDGAGPIPFPLSLFHLPNTPAPAPVSKTKVLGGGVLGGSQAEQLEAGQGQGDVGSPHTPCSPQPGEPRMSFLCNPCVCVAACLAVWLGHLPLCALGVPMPGEVSRGPLPKWPSLCLCRGPKARTLSMCLSPVVLSVCVCSLVLWPLCLCLCGCAMVSMSLLHPCVCLGVCLSIPLLVLCPRLAIPGRGRTLLQLHQ